MNHTGPPTEADEPPVPEPTYAERARTLLYLGRTATLATLSRKHPGHPFASVMPYALDARGRPLLLISSLATHTQNLQADPRASLLVLEATGRGDVLAAGRATLMGDVRPVPAAEIAEVRPAYLAHHPNAAYWVDFADFAFYRMEIRDIYYVGGFARMDWVDTQEYAVARPDPLADAAASIIEHMNRDHADALVTFARVLAREEADAATMVSVDRLGFKLRIQAGARVSSARIPFLREVRTAEESRAVLIEMLRDARQHLPSPPLGERGG